ncbi:MAG TPA: hypothetical protein VE262_02140 [Blastocatellia bacterium]|nr:hypothetical protein [Blastocatellia bacterium]
MLCLAFRRCALIVVISLSGVMPRAAWSAQNSEPRQQESRIKWLLIDIADSARASRDLAFAVRVQTHAAVLLWPQDRECARSIFRRAFESLMPSQAEAEAAPEEGGAPEPAAPVSDLRAELLNQVAGRDPELAEEFARRIAYASDTRRVAARDSRKPDGRDMTSFVPVSSRGEDERRELLISVALQVAERDPHRAMTLGQLSLGPAVDLSNPPPGAQGLTSSIISPKFSRLLTIMRGVDSRLADLLFSSAVARLERLPLVDLDDVHTLGSYVVLAASPSTRGAMSRSLVVRFLDLSFRQIMLQVDSGSGAPDEAANDDGSDSIYFIVRQLSDLFARHLPNQLAELKSKTAQSNDSSVAIDPGSIPASTPVDVTREARLADTDGERDALYARAALGWLSAKDVNAAQATAFKISDANVRDRVLIQIVRRQSAEGQIDDAVAIARRLASSVERIEATVRIAGAALALKDRVRATELLNEAEGESVKLQARAARSRILLSVASSFSAFDLQRSFEVLQAAVKSLNGPAPAPEAGKKPQGAGFDELYQMGLESTFAALARRDFDRALFLAQQLSDEETSVLAQLAVCRGGLAAGRDQGQARRNAEKE